MSDDTNAIKTEWIKIEGEDRLKVSIYEGKDRTIVYFSAEVAESLRVALGVIPARPASGPRFWDVVIDGAKPIRAVGDDEQDAIPRVAMHTFTDLVDVVHIEGDEFEGTASPEDRYFLPSRSRFTATATPATESK